MACTLEELHEAHYELLCKFADYCENNSINYVLHAGTLLGAVRYNSFIPWDDDVDIIMDIKSFNKLVSSIEKEPIEGTFFQWITTEKKHPLQFAKLRKNNTQMTDPFFSNLNIHQGIWIDIFVYLNKPKSKLGIRIQEFLLKLFMHLCHIYIYSEKISYSSDSFISNIKTFFIIFFYLFYQES